MKNSQSGPDSISQDLGQMHLDTNNDISTRKISVDKNPYSVPTNSSKELTVQNTAQGIIVRQMTSPSASFGQKTLESTSGKQHESDNANHSTVYQNSTIAKHSETASHKPKRQKKKHKAVSKTGQMHSPVVFIATRHEPTIQTKKSSSKQSARNRSHQEQANEVETNNESAQEFSMKPRGYYEATFQRSTEQPRGQHFNTKSTLNIMNGQLSMVQPKLSVTNKTPLNDLRMSRNHSDPQFRVVKRQKKGSQLLIPGHIKSQQNLINQILGVKELGGSFPALISNSEEAHSKVQQLVHTGQHRVQPPLEPNRKVQPQYLSKQQKNTILHMNPNVLPVKNIFRSLDRQKSTVKSTPTFSKKRPSLPNSKALPITEQQNTNFLVRSKSNFMGGSEPEGYILPKHNVSYNQLYKAFTSAQNNSHDVTQDRKRMHSSKYKLGPLINIDDPNSQRANLLTPQMQRESCRALGRPPISANIKNLSMIKKAASEAKLHEVSKQGGDQPPSQINSRTRLMSGSTDFKTADVDGAQEQEDITLSRVLEFRDDQSKYRSKTPIPFALEKQPNTPRTRAVKNMVANANRGYQNPLDKNLFQTADKYCKQIDAKIKEEKKSKHEKPDYLYKQVKNGVNVWLRQPYPINVIAGLQKNSRKETNQSAKQRKPLEKQTLHLDLEVKRQKNQNDFLSYVQEAQQKKQINQEIGLIQAQISMLEEDLKKIIVHEPISTEAVDSNENLNSQKHTEVPQSFEQQNLASQDSQHAPRPSHQVQVTMMNQGQPQSTDQTTLQLNAKTNNHTMGMSGSFQSPNDTKRSSKAIQLADNLGLNSDPATLYNYNHSNILVHDANKSTPHAGIQELNDSLSRSIQDPQGYVMTPQLPENFQQIYRVQGNGEVQLISSRFQSQSSSFRAQHKRNNSKERLNIDLQTDAPDPNSARPSRTQQNQSRVQSQPKGNDSKTVQALPNHKHSNSKTVWTSQMNRQEIPTQFMDRNQLRLDLQGVPAQNKTQNEEHEAQVTDGSIEGQTFAFSSPKYIDSRFGMNSQRRESPSKVYMSDKKSLKKSSSNTNPLKARTQLKAIVKTTSSAEKKPLNEALDRVSSNQQVRVLHSRAQTTIAKQMTPAEIMTKSTVGLADYLENLEKHRTKLKLVQEQHAKVAKSNLKTQKDGKLLESKSFNVGNSKQQSYFGVQTNSQGARSKQDK